MQFHQHTLPNGLQVIAELNPSVHSVAAGFFVRTGARDETKGVSGVSHFLEHMAFKGDNRISADDVNRIFDEVGANYNASTGEEVTMYYAAVLPEYLDTTMELLSVLMQPSLGQEDFDMEKNVILEEIGMYDDHPSFTAYDTIMATHFADHPLGQSILGTKESIVALTSDQMQTYHANRYKAGNMTLVVAGNTDFDSLLALAEKHCGSIPAGQCERDLPESIPKPAVRLVTKESSVQQHIMQMGPAPKGTDELRFAAELLSVVVGGHNGVVGGKRRMVVVHAYLFQDNIFLHIKVFLTKRRLHQDRQQFHGRVQVFRQHGRIIHRDFFTGGRVVVGTDFIKNSIHVVRGNPVVSFEGHVFQKMADAGYSLCFIPGTRANKETGRDAVHGRIKFCDDLQTVGKCVLVKLHQ